MADYHDEVLADDPSGYWRLEETSGTVAHNEIPGGLDGTYIGGPRLQSDGAFHGSAGILGAMGAGVSLGPQPQGTHDWTVETWVRQKGGGYYDGIFTREGLWGVYHLDPGTSLVCWGGRWPFSWASIHDDRWHLVTVRNEGGWLSLFIDGIPQDGAQCGSLTGDAPLVAGTGGASAAWANLPPAGTRGIDEISVYDHALSNARIAAHAAARTAADDGAQTPQPSLTGGPYTTAVLNDHPWGYWRLEDDPLRTGALLADASGNGHDGSMWPRGWQNMPSGPVTTEPDRALGMNGSALGLPSLPAGTPGQSLELWAKFTVSPGLYSTGLVRTPTFFGYLHSWALALDAYDSYIPTSARLHDRAWHHLVFTFDAAAHEEVTYIDGVAVQTLHDIQNLEWFSAGTTLVGDLGVVAGTCLDEIALYDHVLPADSVAAHHDASGFRAANGGCGGTPDVPPDLAGPPPVSTSAPTVSGEGRVGATLTCDPGAWDGATRFTYTWERGGFAVATGPTYTLTEDDADAELRCVVTGSDGAGQSTRAASAATTWLRRPAAPGALTVDAGDPDADGALSVSWDAVDGAEGYVVERAAEGGGWTAVGTTSETRLDLAGEPDGTWRYRVRAIAAGVSSAPAGPSRAVLVDTTAPSLSLDCPAQFVHVGDAATAAVHASDAGSGLAAAAPAALDLDTSTPGDRTLTFSVTDRAGHRTDATCDYHVRYRVPVAPRQVAGSAPSPDGNLAIGWSLQGSDPDAAAYVLEARDADDADWQVVATGPSRSWTAPAGGLAEGTWTFRVRADDPAFEPGWSAPSDPVVVDRSAPRPPRITTDRAPDADAPGTADDWWADTVTVIFGNAGDPDLADGSKGSGVDPASVPAAGTFTTTGAHAVSGTERDLAGNVSAVASDTFRVDATAPTQSLSCPATVLLDAAATGSWTAADVGSGLAGPASGTIPLDASSVGPHTATAPSVRDRVGHTAPAATCSYTVIYDWSGFLAPTDEEPTVNDVRSGDAFPVRFALAGDRGLGVLAVPPVTVLLPAASCKFNKDKAEEVVPAATPDFAYDAVTGLYTWVLRSDRSMKGDCRELVVTLADGTEHRALFHFK